MIPWTPDGISFSPGLFARISLPIGEPRETVLIDDLAVSADQGKRADWAASGESGGVSSG